MQYLNKFSFFFAVLLIQVAGTAIISAQKTKQLVATDNDFDLKYVGNPDISFEVKLVAHTQKTDFEKGESETGFLFLQLMVVSTVQEPQSVHQQNQSSGV